jgi:chorismate synthase
MSANSFGKIFKITTFGESHGQAIGVIIEGCPAGVHFKKEILSDMVKRRRPGTSDLVTARNESDEPEILSGVFEDKTLGTPIALITRNQDARSEDYKNIDLKTRSGHADDLWRSKFGHSDIRGGGRASGRETWGRVVSGAFAKMYIEQVCTEYSITAFPSRVGPFALSEKDVNFSAQSEMILPIDVTTFLKQAKENGESHGGAVKVIVKGIPSGLGQPVFHKLKSDIAMAMMSIGATNAIEFGEGIDAQTAKGTEFHSVRNYGGIRGGLSTGEPIEVTVTFKPTSSIQDVAKKGRHDPCIVLRASVVCEAMMNLVLADHLLLRNLDRI